MKFKAIFLLSLFVVGCKGVSQEKETALESKPTKIEHFAITKTDAEWRNQLTDAQYYVLRKAGTENPWTSGFLENKKKGIYVCAACGTELFKSDNKFESGTGWPSFDQEIKGNVAFEIDNSMGVARTEEHCATCGGHLGHVFDDGPHQTTGKRHCVNGVALKFVPAK